MTRSLSFFRFTLIVILLITAIFQPQSSAYAAANLTVIPITWNVVGLDSNNVNVGQTTFRLARGFVIQGMFLQQM